MADLARELGIAFEMTGDTERQLREVGATEELLKRLRDLSAKAAGAEVTSTLAPSATPPPAPPPPPVLVVETSPPGAEIYVDEERAGKTGPEGKLKISTLAPCQHRVRASLKGYLDYAREIDLSSGQSTVMAVVLQQEKARATEPAAPTASQPPVVISPGALQMPGDYSDFLRGTMPKDEPGVKRFYVTHNHGSSRWGRFGLGGMAGMCYGSLVIAQGRVMFTSNEEDHAFDVATTDISDLQLKGNHLRLSVKGKKYHLVMQDTGLTGNFQRPDELRDALEESGLKTTK